ncbi:MAG: acetyltransferase [Candidatus Cloacimonas sp.]|jgi:acetyltransferase EpsM|nr:acetyltransferase [Candidatus Cloacimonas sp.]
MKKRLIIIGGVGGAQIAMTTFEDANTITGEWELVGYLSDIAKPGVYFGKYKILGRTEEIYDYVQKGYYIHNTLFYNAKFKEERTVKYEAYNIPLEANASVVHPTAYVNPSTKIGYGVLISPHCSSSYGPVIGNFVHMYTNAFIGHDSVIEDYATLTAHSIVGGRVHVEKGAHVGLNACIREDLTIGKFAVIGMGAVVVSNVPDYAVVVGNPAKIIKTVKEYVH